VPGRPGSRGPSKTRNKVGARTCQRNSGRLRLFRAQHPEVNHYLVPDPRKDTEQPRPGTPAGHYRVPRQERGENTRERARSIVGIVVVAGTRGRHEGSMGVVVRPLAGSGQNYTLRVLYFLRHERAWHVVGPQQVFEE
jgi:hypothetical protein